MQTSIVTNKNLEDRLMRLGRTIVVPDPYNNEFRRLKVFRLLNSVKRFGLVLLHKSRTQR